MGDLSLTYVDVEYPLTQALDSVGLKLDRSLPVASLKRLHQPNRKSAVYRINVRHPTLKMVVAKRSKTGTAVIEQQIYERILPQLSISAPSFYGHFQEDDGKYTWLFLEDVEGDFMSWENPAHRSAAARWLANLHVSAARIPETAALPERDPDHFHRHMESSQHQLDHIAENPEFRECRDLAYRISDQLMMVDHIWPLIHQWIGTMPSTLVHGDFESKNMRIVKRSAGPQVCVYDWEQAGHGVPAVDLWRIDYSEYFQALGDSEFLSSSRDVWHINHLGRLFRALASIDWTMETLTAGWSLKMVNNLETFSLVLARSIEGLSLVES